MSIFSRFSTMIKSNLNDLISRAEDPEKMLNQIILDMRDQLAKAKREVAGAIADERKLKRQVDEATKQMKAWERRAVLAVQEGRDDMAKQALVRHEEQAEHVAAFQKSWEAQKQETENLKASLRQLHEKIEEAKRKRNLLIAKQKRAQAQKRIHETMSGLSDTSAFEAFNRMAERIEEDERRNLAQAEVNEALSGDTLEQEFVRLEAGTTTTDLDDKLLALKAKMGLLGSGEPEAPKQLEAGDGKDDEAADADAPQDTPIRDAELIEEFERLERRGGQAN
ncbi:MAG: PspA/IM30 family protein [Gemmatimonadetes bacterium]|nr:PspA/IM30 family protein [Gemmatimonadota bacterium]MYC92641.1 PspA/IM30 family protein [Gemmatimonadota bacterium]MYJ18600.1 PspA/IM30 family protein [Gemmatimonadota bacterium]